MSTSPPLAGKSALVTGASRGIGRETARRLAADGALVGIHYSASEAEAESLLAQIKADGGKAFLVRAELTDAAQVERLASDTLHQLTQHTGKAQLDILVNNAGIAPFLAFTETDAATLDRIFAVNVRAPFLLTAKLSPHIPDGGRVIFTSTAVTKTSFPDITAYAASKGAVDTLIIHLAAELGPKGIRVTGVAPGAINTDLTAWMRSKEGEAQVYAIQALQRIGQPKDIANVIAFLAGPDGAWVTGEIINASGGTKL